VIHLLEQGRDMQIATWDVKVCKRAALAARNDRVAALEWLLDHGDDLDFNEPLPDPEPEVNAEPEPQVITEAEPPTASGVDREYVQTLCAAGFSQGATEFALVACGGDVEAALELLVESGGAPAGMAPGLHTGAPAPAPVLGGPQLPPGWRQCEDAEGKTFYQDDNTQTTHWHPPAMQVATRTGGSMSRRQSRSNMRPIERKPAPRLFVFDISPTASGNLSQILFELLMQRELRSSDGQVFHRRTDDIYIIEHSLSDSQCIPILDFVPLRAPLSPAAAIRDSLVELGDERDSFHRAHFYLSADREAGQHYHPSIRGSDQVSTACLYSHSARKSVH
jgi:hypothetical protein